MTSSTLTQPSRRDFVLGTAQLGAAYGWTNSSGELSEAAAFALMERAYELGVRTFDTARANTGSEERIGRFVRAHGLRDLTIITKLAPLAELGAGASPADAASAASRSLASSREALGLERLGTLLLHRAAHLDDYGGAVLDVLLAEQAGDRIGAIGVSVNGPEEFARAAGRPEVRHVQLPFNLLDRRWPPFPQQAARPTIHVRSVFLQGLLANAAETSWPGVEGFDAPPLVAALSALVRELGRASLADLAIAYVRAEPWADGCVMGVERPDQLAQNLDLFDRPPLSSEERSVVRSALPDYPDALVQPWLWRR